MSTASLRVELPAYSHSFEVQVTPVSTIRDVKLEIARVCPGSPSPVGQRLIWRGRFLKDEEKVEDVWKSPDDSRVIHLAVHPSAWTSTPPTFPSTPVNSSFTPQPTPTQTRPSGQSAPSPSWLPPPPAHLTHPYPPAGLFPPVAYIQHVHNYALAVLSAGAVTLPTQPTITELEAWRTAAKDFYRARGWPWPSVFEDPYPSGSIEEGAVYRPVTLEGLPYLQLANPGANPTPSQMHALRVLSHTFSILSIPPELLLYQPVSQYHTPPYATATDVNQHLQQLGLPALRLAHNPAAAPNPNDPNNHNPLAAPGPGGAEIRAIPVRALMVPLLMLAFRTLLLLYFFSPSKRPLFGILLSVWILYEAWNAMRMVLNEGNERGPDGGANPAAPNAPAGAGQPAAPGAGPAGLNANGAAPNAAAGRSGFNAILDRLSMLNISAEDALLDTDAPAPPPSLAQKTKMFLTLFFMSLHPAAWDRRRAALRRREGRIRTEANAREAALAERAERAQAQAQGGAEGQEARSEEDEARTRAREQIVIRYEGRPEWLKRYVQRVQYTEWVDDP